MSEKPIKKLPEFNSIRVFQVGKNTEVLRILFESENYSLRQLTSDLVVAIPKFPEQNLPLKIKVTVKKPKKGVVKK